MEKVDLIVVGGGSGLDVAVAAAGQGLKVAIIEKGPLGGTCLNRGCIPSKMLIHSADVAETINRAHLFGIKTNGYSIDFTSIVERVTKTVDEDARAIEEGLQNSDNPRLYKEESRFVGEKTLQVGTELIQAEKILIASGTRPRIPSIEGLKDIDYITSDQALRLKTQPKVLTIIGGGYIAVELAHFFGALGTKINIVQRHNLLIPNEDAEIAERFTEIIKRKYNVLTKFNPIKAFKSRDKFVLTAENTEDKTTRTLESDQLLIAAGRIPNSDTLAVHKTGVKTDEKGFIITDEYLETNVKGIFALGDAVGHYLFKHSANLEAQYEFNNILDPENKVPVDYSAMPHAIFSSPQVAGVGLTEQQLKTKRVDYLVGKYRYIDTGMGMAIEDNEGFVKFLVERGTGKILGCHILGIDASTLIHEVLVAMKIGDGTIQNVRRVVHIHPALSEVVQRAASNLNEA